MLRHRATLKITQKQKKHTLGREFLSTLHRQAIHGMDMLIITNGEMSSVKVQMESTMLHSLKLRQSAIGPIILPQPKLSKTKVSL